MENMEIEKRNSFWKHRKVFVTGHEGFLGSWLVKTLLVYGAQVIGLDKVKNRPFSVLKGYRKDITCLKGNIVNYKLVKDTIDIYKPQIIFHLAAEAIVEKANRNPVHTFKSNIEGTWNILEGSRGKKTIEAIVISSSDKAYGSHKTLPYKEDTALKGAHPYDASKSCADILCYTYYNTYRLPVCVTRCGNIYGPGDYNFSRIVPDTIRASIGNKTLIIRSDGKFTRDFIYVEDIVNGYILLAEKLQKLKLSGEAFNFSYEKSISVLELVGKIYKLADKKPDYKIHNQAKYEIKHQYLSSDKAKRILGWMPRYNLKQGLKETIKWYKKSL